MPRDAPPPLHPNPGFVWAQVRWSGPQASLDDTCSYCSAPVADTSIPLRLWRTDGWAAVFCVACMRRWWGIASDADDGEED